MLSKSTIKYIQSLQQKKFREQHRAFAAEGPKVVGELLQNPLFRPMAVFSIPAWFTSLPRTMQDVLRSIYEEVDEPMLGRIAFTQSPNQVMALFEMPDHIPVPGRKGITLVLDDIRDPGNMGTIIRLADWFGVVQLICSESCVDIYNPKVVQSSMGSLGRSGIISQNLTDYLRKQVSMPVIAAVLHGEHPNSLGNLPEAILVIGNEATGINKDILSMCNRQITIPRYGQAESLNAAVATGILLYALKEGPGAG